jgi:hypothetical protein
MNLRWLSFDYIDPELELTNAQRREVTRLAIERYHAASPTKAFMPLTMVAAAAFFALNLFGASDAVIVGVLCGAVFLGFVGTMVFWRRVYAPATWASLRDIDFDVCPHCGYWLRGLSLEMGQCPECGAARTPLPNCTAEGTVERVSETAWIRIIAPARSEAPEEIRQAWVGIVLPLAANQQGLVSRRCVGVVSGPRHWVGQWALALGGRGRTERGFLVDAKKAIELLEQHNPAAADWWKRNANHLLKPRQQLLFHKDCCAPVPTPPSVAASPSS